MLLDGGRWRTVTLETKYIRESEESTLIRFEQKQVQKRSRRPRRAKSVLNDNVLVDTKQRYPDGDLNIDDYQKQLWSLAYRYINIFDKSDKDDLDYEPSIVETWLLSVFCDMWLLDRLSHK